MENLGEEYWFFEELFSKDAMDFDCDNIDEVSEEDFALWNRKFTIFKKLRLFIKNYIDETKELFD
ncbi:MAG: hypothetical protein FWG44_00570 [Oscillospiraceae bacterium]|nr:hypothetical protein [Oscillospiraceae bacterium]